MSPAEAGVSVDRLNQAIRFASSKGGAGFVVRHGHRIASWGDVDRPYKLYSATKGFGSLLLGLALEDGRMGLNDLGKRWLPEIGTPPDSNRSRGWSGRITVKMLACHTAGFELDGGFTPMRFEPGTKYLYSNGGANWLADVMTMAFEADLARVLERRVLEPIGCTARDWRWRDNIYRPKLLRGLERREFGSGIDMSAQALARVGLLLLRRGQWQGRQVLDTGYVDRATHPDPSLAAIRSFSGGDSSPMKHLNLLIQNNTVGLFPGLPRDAFMFRGKYTQHVVVVPSLDLIVVRLGERGWDSSSSAINAVFQGFAAAARDR